MPAPTFVAEYEIPYNAGTTPRTVSVTTAVGDVLVIGSGTESNSTTINAPTGGTGTYVLQETLAPASNCGMDLYTAVAGISAQTYSLSVSTDSGIQWWGTTAGRFSGSDGIGAAESSNATTAPSLSITTTQANSALFAVFYDWNAVDGDSRTWRAVNGTTPTAGNGFELAYFRDAFHYGCYVAYWPDAGAVGAKSVGLSAPTLKWVGAVVEVKGTASASQVPARPVVLSQAVRRAASY